MLLLLIYISKNITYLNSKVSVYILVVIAVLRVVLDKNVFTVGLWIFFIPIVVYFLVLRTFLVNMATAVFTKSIKVSDLKYGMIRVELINRKGKTSKKLSSSKNIKL